MGTSFGIINRKAAHKTAKYLGRLETLKNKRDSAVDDGSRSFTKLMARLSHKIEALEAKIVRKQAKWDAKRDRLISLAVMALKRSSPSGGASLGTSFESFARDLLAGIEASARSAVEDLKAKIPEAEDALRRIFSDKSRDLAAASSRVR